MRKAQEETGLDDAILNAVGQMGPHEVVLSAMEYGFIGGSMGAVVGETIARAVDRARLTRKPLIVVAASGGARMMEGVVSLMQMAKISTALAQLDDARVPYICVLTDPTTGGVTASFAMLGDLNIAEPGALIGFAGPRVIEQTIRQKLPEGFQRCGVSARKGLSRRGRASPGFEGLFDSRAGLPEDANGGVEACTFSSMFQKHPGSHLSKCGTWQQAGFHGLGRA